jgi:hypothetical protein
VWHKDPDHHGSEEILPPPTKKSCLDGARNSIARCAAQIRTGHWRSAVYLKGSRRQVLVLPGAELHDQVACSPPLPERQNQGSPHRGLGRQGPGKCQGPPVEPTRWERSLLRFLELSGVGRVMEDGVDEEEARAGRLDRWIPWETEEWVVPRAPD